MKRRELVLPGSACEPAATSRGLRPHPAPSRKSRGVTLASRPATLSLLHVTHRPQPLQGGHGHSRSRGPPSLEGGEVPLGTPSLGPGAGLLQQRHLLLAHPAPAQCSQDKTQGDEGPQGRPLPTRRCKGDPPSASSPLRRRLLLTPEGCARPHRDMPGHRPVFLAD